jgi:hypothetical protein
VSDRYWSDDLRESFGQEDTVVEIPDTVLAVMDLVRKHCRFSLGNDSNFQRDPLPPRDDQGIWFVFFENNYD